MARGGKVIHISDEFHRKFRKFVQQYKIQKTSEWVEDKLMLCMETCQNLDQQLGEEMGNRFGPTTK